MDKNWLFLNKLALDCIKFELRKKNKACTLQGVSVVEYPDEENRYALTFTRQALSLTIQSLTVRQKRSLLQVFECLRFCVFDLD